MFFVGAKPLTCSQFFFGRRQYALEFFLQIRLEGRHLMMLQDLGDLISGPVINGPGIIIPVPIRRRCQKCGAKPLLPAQMLQGVGILHKFAAMAHPVDGFGGQGVGINFNTFVKLFLHIPESALP